MKVANCSAPSKVCAVVLDEMTIKEGVSYNPSRDEVEGYEDFGYLGRTAFIANHAIVGIPSPGAARQVETASWIFPVQWYHEWAHYGNAT